MKNITVSVPDTTYFKARVWAAEHETSISAVVAHLLEILPTHKGAARQFTPPDPPPKSATGH
ncbi:MAG: hypothetical protein ABSD59_24920 [Terracidiphilus sp.]|jgi:hypothetical protein